jgi:hypothetical protein
MRAGALAIAACVLAAQAPAWSAPKLQIQTKSLADGKVGVAYSETVQASGGTPPYIWRVSEGALPAGLSLSLLGGEISGTPTTPGTSNFTITAADVTLDSDSVPFSIVVHGVVQVGPTSLPGGVVGQPYSQKLSASGGIAPYSWSVAAGSLPAGLSLSGDTIAGTPTTTGMYSFTIRATDASGDFGDQAYSITISVPPLAITTSSLPNGTVGVAYSQTLQASGGTGGYSWSIVSGSLPAGINLSVDPTSRAGNLTGTPTTAGRYDFVVRVTDSSTQIADKPLSITVVVPPLTITTSSLPNGTVGVAYSQTLQASGGTGGYSWAIVSGSLPAGVNLSVDPTSRAANLTGTPTTAGRYDFVVRVTDSSTQTADKPLSITVVIPPLAITTSSLPNGTVGVAYSQTLQASGGTGGYAWSIASGSLPAGINLSVDPTSRAATLAGTPTTAGRYDFVVRVTDSSSQTADKPLSITIVLPPIGITTKSLPNGTVGVAYSQTLAAAGGSGVYTWSIADGALPPGLSLVGSVIKGTPQTAGAYSFTVRVADDAGNSAQQALSLTVVLPPVKVTTTSAANGTVGVPYSQPLAATGGTGTYSWSVASGALPPGLSIAGSAIVGTPSDAGSFAFTVRATDTASNSADQALSITIATPVRITACPAGSGLAGQPYSSSASATGGQPPYSWSVSAGQLPPGLTLNSGSGAVSGTPTQAGSYSFTLRVAETGASTAATPCTIAITPPLAITTASLANGSAGGLYLQQLSASGGAPPYTWSITAGSLPPGLSLDASTGQISGTATAPNTYNFGVGVADSAGSHAQRDLTITIVTGVAITACPAPSATLGRPYSSAPTAAGGQQPYTWSTAAGVLPEGLTLNPSTAQISGTPTSSGNFDFSIKAVDQGGSAATLACTITVRLQLAIPELTLPEAAVRVQYSFSFTATGGTPPYSWSTQAGALPPGVTLNQSGIVSGTPTTTGSFAFSVRVQDTAGQSAERQLTLTVNPGLTIPACPAGVAETGSPYTSDVAAVGGTTPYSWSIDSGALPPGINVEASTGRVSGTPSQTGDFNFVLRVSDSAGRAVTRSCSISVAAGLSITTTSLPDAVLAAPYSQAIAVTGGTPPYAWSTAAGGLPPGLFLNSGTGRITGTPTVAGSFSFTVRVNDSAGGEITQVMTLRVTAGLAITDCPLPITVVGQPYSATATVQSGAPPFTWSLAGGALPDGLTLDPSTGTISGTPPTAAVASYTISVVDSKGVSAIRACTLSVTTGELKITTPANLEPAVSGASYSVEFAASGGVGAYSWSLISGALPEGLALDGSGKLTGSPTKTGVYQFSVQVTDEGGETAAQAFTLSVLVAAGPSITLQGLSDFVAPAQQPAFSITLDKPYPAALTGTIQLSFTPDGSLGVDDPAIRFSNGSRTLNFTVPENSTQAQFDTPGASLQTGTVAGAIELDVTLQSSDSSTVAGLRKLVRIDRIAPRITNIEASRNASGVQVVIIGYSTTRDVTSGAFRFTPAGGGAPVEVNVPMTDAAAQWFRSADSTKFGGEFKLTLPFTFQGGSFSSVTAILNNPQGGSDPATSNF